MGGTSQAGSPPSRLRGHSQHCLAVHTAEFRACAGTLVLGPLGEAYGVQVQNVLLTAELTLHSCKNLTFWLVGFGAPPDYVQDSLLALLKETNIHQPATCKASKCLNPRIISSAQDSVVFGCSWQCWDGCGNRPCYTRNDPAPPAFKACIPAL